MILHIHRQLDTSRIGTLDYGSQTEATQAGNPEHNLVILPRSGHVFLICVCVCVRRHRVYTFFPQFWKFHGENGEIFSNWRYVAVVY